MSLKLPIKNWDNKTWLSSTRYIQNFNKFLSNNQTLNKNSIILDIGCGRGKILGYLSSKLKLNRKPIGLDIENHKDKNKKIIFKKKDGLSYLSDTKKNFDLIIIKQTIHLLKISQTMKLIKICKKKLNKNGKIMILGLDPKNNEIPTFLLMSQKLQSSLKKDKRIFDLIIKSNPKTIIKKFIFNVKISKKKYIEMIKKRYISTLLSFTDKQIVSGQREINSRYSANLKFNDKLICLIIKNN